MAGDWIKMRGALFQSPKLITAARLLNESQPFREWLTPGGGGPLNGQIVSDDALRCVTCALLLRVWSAAREFGKFDGDDLFLPHISILDLDTMAGAPGVGKVMEAVGWAINGDGVILPNFKQHNVPLSNAEKQKEYRQRHNKTVTAPLPARGNKSVTREEKRREEKKKDINPPNPPEGGDELFRAIAEATGTDPATNGKAIRKATETLRAATPPYTPSDVREFARRLWEFCPTMRDKKDRPSAPLIARQIGLLRAAKKKPRRQPPATSTNGDDKPMTQEEIRAAYEARGINLAGIGRPVE